MLDQIMTFATNSDIMAAVLTALLAIVIRFFQPKSSLKWGKSHLFTYLIPQKGGGSQTIHSQSLILWNSGRAAAEDIEIYLNYEPEHFEIWPVCEYSIKELENRRFLLGIKYIEKKKQYNLEFLQSVGEIPSILQIRTKHGEAKMVNFGPQPVYSKGSRLAISAILLLGFYKTIELILTFFI